MGQAIQQSAGQTLRTEDAGPFVKRQIAGDQCRVLFIATAERLEQQLRPDGGKGHITEFIDDQQIHPGQLLLQRAQTPFIACLQQFMDQRGAPS